MFSRDWVTSGFWYQFYDFLPPIIGGFEKLIFFGKVTTLQVGREAHPRCPPILTRRHVPQSPYTQTKSALNAHNSRYKL